MRTLKMLFLVVVALALVILGVANMAPVDLYLFPAEAGGEAFSAHEVPLAGVIFGSVLVGLVAGQVIEYLREAKHRRAFAEKRAENVRLRREILRLQSEVEAKEEPLPRLPAR